MIRCGAGIRRNCVATVNLNVTPDLAKIATHARNAEYNPRVCEPVAVCPLFVCL